MFWAKLLSGTTVATYALAPQPTMVSSTKWLSRAVTNADYPALEKISESAVKDKQKFERIVASKEDPSNTIIV